jgi:hypothetical protein
MLVVKEHNVCPSVLSGDLLLSQMAVKGSKVRKIVNFPRWQRAPHEVRDSGRLTIAAE